MTEVLRANKYRIYPNADQQIKLNQTFGCVRFVWNKLVENFNSWTPETKLVKVTEKSLKDSGEFDWLYDVSATALQQKRIDLTRRDSW